MASTAMATETLTAVARGRESARGREREVVLAARAGGERARADLVEAFLPRIAGVAGEYRGVRSVTREELTQAGVVGLLTALERYEPERENQFWTYARWWVRRAMQELVSSLNNAVVFSDRALRQLARVNQARHHHVQRRGREPSTRDLASLTGLPAAQVTQLVGAAQPARAFDERPETERTGARALEELLHDPAGEDAIEHATLRVAARSLPPVLATLTPRELAIVRARYGLDAEQRSVPDLAAELQLSSERVRQIERRAMSKLRESCDAAPVAA
jgi:RNA polymerase sigma factor (sigma-70 family)